MFVSKGKDLDRILVDFGLVCKPSEVCEFPLALVSSPKTTGGDPGKDKSVDHFEHLYFLSAVARKDFVLPVCKCEGLDSVPEVKASNIFCPGGEGEGEDGEG
jgi:hypothetical protein